MNNELTKEDAQVIMQFLDRVEVKGVREADMLLMVFSKLNQMV